MASQGPNSPGTVISSDVTGNVAWSNPGNAASSNNSYADTGGSVTGGTISDSSVSLAEGGDESGDKATLSALDASDTYRVYGGAADLWPSGLTLTPAAVNSSDFSVRFQVNDGNDTWIASELLVASDFGFSIPGGATIDGVKVEVEQKAGGGVAYVDHVRVTVYYTDAGAPATVTPGVASLTLTRYAPTALAPRLCTPGLAALTATRYAPAVSAPRAVTPGVASLALTGLAPTVRLGPSVTPGTLALTLAGFAPTALAPRLVTPGARALALTTYLPSVAATSPPPTATGAMKLRVPRDPDAPKRTRLHIDVVAALLNGLIDGGALTQTGAAAWQITAAAITLDGLSVYGRSADSSGQAAAITAGSDHQSLRRSGTALGFGSIDLSQAAAVTGRLPAANLPQVSAASRLLGRGSSGGAGNVQEISLDATLTLTGTVLSVTTPAVVGVHDEPLTDGDSNFIFAVGDIVVVVGVPN